MFDKALDKISIENIEALVRDKIPESRIFEYKLQVHPENSKGNEEFLKDISAFANTVGGYLIYGVEEKKGIPVAIKGVDVDDFDKLKQRFDNLLRMGVDPPIRGVLPSPPIDCPDSKKKIIVVRVPKSVGRPHVVKINKHFRFYGRNSSGVHPLEVDDLRRAFLASETLATRIRTFRNDRIAQIASGQMPIPVQPGAKVVLHLIPESAFELGKRCDLKAIRWLDVPPLYVVNASGWDRKPNYDGCIFFKRSEAPALSYTQVFREGIIEAVAILCLAEKKKEFPAAEFRQEIENKLSKYMSVEAKLRVDFPIWVCLSLLGVKGHSMSVGHTCLEESYTIDRDELVIPEVEVEQAQVSITGVLRPVFDVIGNACGRNEFPGSRE